MEKRTRLSGLVQSRVRQWNDCVQEATAVNPLDMDVGQLAEEVFTLRNLLSNAVGEIKFLVGVLDIEQRVLN